MNEWKYMAASCWGGVYQLLLLDAAAGAVDAIADAVADTDASDDDIAPAGFTFFFFFLLLFFLLILCVSI